MTLALLLLAPAAAAEPSESERAIAESLFQQAKTLSKKGDYAAACPKFAESFRIDAAGGTALNLADCLEHDGKLASAYGMFQKARVMALGASRQDRVQIADEHLAALAPRLSHVIFAVPPAARVAGLEVLLDGVSLGPASWGTPLMVDAGEHAVLARAPARTE
ncbi:MAG: hypothetical protein NVSMB47_12270 [Polyangiales bacterium]